MKRLLAIDLGVKTGLALYNDQCHLEWYRSQNYGNKNRLQRAVYGILKDIDNLAFIVVEGGGHLFSIWKKEADRLGIESIQLQAFHWRKEILFDREQRSGISAKQHAQIHAIRVIEQLGTSKPKSLTDDTAEAILTGFWALKKLNWIQNLPTIKR